MLTYEVITTQAYDEWHDTLDKQARGRITLRLLKAEMGNLGDIEPVGNGVFEMREHFGPGYRVYFINQGLRILVILGGGDKSTQKKDIKKAKAFAARIKPHHSESERVKNGHRQH
ncbi:type II toxin-antitoxin system RelE/ParE family toxin [Pinirhizobacter soli]|uniref:type II toxin-antitoxin system RelE/ParE family toxin n=1 Tax=Pinirhizobacter soli TaxID=2786953 RepID=UPI00202A77B9